VLSARLHLSSAPGDELQHGVVIECAGHSDVFLGEEAAALRPRAEHAREGFGAALVAVAQVGLDPSLPAISAADVFVCGSFLALGIGEIERLASTVRVVGSERRCFMYAGLFGNAPIGDREPRRALPFINAGVFHAAEFPPENGGRQRSKLLQFCCNRKKLTLEARAGIEPARKEGGFPVVAGGFGYERERGVRGELCLNLLQSSS
jgi:hypothetical protein